MTLYHYSPLFHLPAILAEGLAKGEVATPDLSLNIQAVSLTTQTDPDRIHAWGRTVGAGPKAAVRYVCDIDPADPALVPQIKQWEGMGMTTVASRRRLDPAGQAKWWSVYHGVIQPGRFAVELRGAAGYRRLTVADRVDVARKVEAVRDKFVLIRPPGRPWALDVELIDEHDPTALWVLDEVYPADRLFSR